MLQLRRPVGVTPLVGAGYLHLFGAGGFVLLALLAREPLPSPTIEAWGALGYLIVAGSIVSFTSYIRALHALPTSVAMTYAYVNPVIAVILGAMLLREPLTPPILGGMALILIGVWGVFREQFGRRRSGPAGAESRG
jgi:drug/metabolite transporter (DMT)-like permease